MKRAEMKVGAAYAIASPGYDRDHMSAKEGILLDTRINLSRGFVSGLSRPISHGRGGSNGTHVLMLMRNQGITLEPEKAATLEEAMKFQPDESWVDRWIAVFRKSWLTDDQKEDYKKLQGDVPKGWAVVATTAARVWMPWAEYLEKEADYAARQAVARRAQVERAAALASSAKRLASEASEAGLKRFTVSTNGEKITLDAEDFRKLVSGSLRATA